MTEIIENKTKPSGYISSFDIRIENPGEEPTIIRLQDNKIEISGPIYPKILRWLAELTLEIRELNRGNGHRIGV